MGAGAGKGGYVHWVPKAKLNPNFRDGLEYITIIDLNQLKEILMVAPFYVAWDLGDIRFKP